MGIGPAARIVIHLRAPGLLQVPVVVDRRVLRVVVDPHLVAPVHQKAGLLLVAALLVAQALALQVVDLAPVLADLVLVHQADQALVLADHQALVLLLCQLYHVQI